MCKIPGIAVIGDSYYSYFKTFAKEAISPETTFALTGITCATNVYLVKRKVRDTSLSAERESKGEEKDRYMYKHGAPIRVSQFHSKAEVFLP